VLFLFLPCSLFLRLHDLSEIFLHFGSKLLLSLLLKWQQCVGNYRPISIPNNYSKIFEFVIHNNVSHYFKSVFNPCQRVFIKSVSTVAIFPRRLEFVTRPVYAQRQLDVVYNSEFSNLLKLFCGHWCTAYVMIRELVCAGYVH
jgi:hypothetical protein